MVYKDVDGQDVDGNGRAIPQAPSGISGQPDEQKPLTDEELEEFVSSLLDIKGCMTPDEISKRRLIATIRADRKRITELEAEKDKWKSWLAQEAATLRKNAPLFTAKVLAAGDNPEFGGEWIDLLTPHIIQLEESLRAPAVDRDAVLEGIIEIVQEWLNAYPEDVFVPPTKKQVQQAHAVLRGIGMSLDVFSANMGRHMARRILSDIEVLKSAKEGK